MKTKSIFKKIIITISAVAILAAGTIVSAYAATTRLGFISDFLLQSRDDYYTYTNTSSKGMVVDQLGSYPTILDDCYDYSEGYAYIFNKTEGKYYGRKTNYYVQYNYPAPVDLRYADVSSGLLEHRWFNCSGGGFRTTLTCTLYT
ncbi:MULTISPECIES: hypothetical protein [unclassified Ruminococcus]|uniref:hypothetical protein n=1 Tax=unclassified Ruminococcus TaxID=2608920 RepID=UPI00210B9224|nr:MULTISPECIES: hypothetical protein [unclassified Ruminococcus]MCQ4022897.1 hypothetical protein [Ruminococcus sp. zg-924]MCQ4115287.1 hypothetical protein [Ruminococcus sp. zg-921]